MVGTVERDKALGMTGGFEDAPRMVDLDHLVGGRVQHQERPPESADALALTLPGEIVDQRPANTKRTAGERHVGFLRRGKLGRRGQKRLLEMLGLGRRADRHHRLDLGDPTGHREDGGPAEAVPDQEIGGPPTVPQKVDRGAQVLQIGREVGVGEIALAFPQTGEVKAKDLEPLLDQRPGDPHDRLQVLRAGKAMGKKGEPPGGFAGGIETRGELLTARAGESHSLGHQKNLRAKDGSV